jgi:hypothetical protein
MNRQHQILAAFVLASSGTHARLPFRVANDKRQLIVTDIVQNNVLKAAAVSENFVRNLSWRRRIIFSRVGYAHSNELVGSQAQKRLTRAMLFV